jgi:hypothetical protein
MGPNKKALKRLRPACEAIRLCDEPRHDGRIAPKIVEFLAETIRTPAPVTVFEDSIAATTITEVPNQQQPEILGAKRLQFRWKRAEPGTSKLAYWES